MTTIHYAGLPCDGIGWGTCNTNLSRELMALVPTQLVDPGYTASELDVVFTPIADHNLRPAFEGRCKKLVGYGFFEFPLTPIAAANAMRYDVIFVGSTWCKQWVESQLVEHPPIEVLVQGVDSKLFRPAPRAHKGFVIFSGGKFEWRKGQDIVIRVVAKLQEKYEDVHLISAWWNPWPAVIMSMAKSQLIKWELVNGDLELEHLCDVNGCDLERVCMLGRTAHANMPDVMNTCDCALLPSRSEGGTNLVLMESMACALPTVATNVTGHTDILTPQNSFGCAVDIDELVEAVEMVRRNRMSSEAMGAQARKDIEKWTWERTARTAVETMQKYKVL